MSMMPEFAPDRQVEFTLSWIEHTQEGHLVIEFPEAGRLIYPVKIEHMGRGLPTLRSLETSVEFQQAGAVVWQQEEGK